MTISNVPPGIYDVIWRMRIDKSLEKPIINFSTDIWIRHDIYLNSYERCPVDNHITVENDADSDYDYDSMDENFSVAHNNSSYISVTDETANCDKDGNKSKKKGLRKHKKLSKALCIS